MIKGREAKAAAASADLLVCFPKFPTRPHLTIMPKPICSPVRPSEPNKRHTNSGSHHRRKRSISRIGGGGGQASPLLWSKTKSMGSEISEPTSPKVTCAGQIKVRPKAAATACRSWQSVMEEIEKIHNDKKQRKRLGWAESLGFKKEVMQFLTCLRSIRFDFRCFGSFPAADIATEDDDEDEDDEEGGGCQLENRAGTEEEEEESSRTVFSKWFMVLQEEQSKEEKEDNESVCESPAAAVPPPNALLLMRCRSAPAKSWLKESEGGGDSDGDGNGNNHEEEKGKNRGKEKEKEKEKAEAVIKKGQSLKSLMEEEKRKKENLVVMRYDPDLYEISADIAKETWIVGGLMDPLSRSRSWKR